MQVRYSYLQQQFKDCDDLWEKLKEFVPTGDFTLGKPLQEFEEKFAKLIGTKHAIGVNSGTDAIKLALKVKADGIYIPSFNKRQIFSNLENRNFSVIGSAHSHKEIHNKIRKTIIF